MKWSSISRMIPNIVDLAGRLMSVGVVKVSQGTSSFKFFAKFN